MQSMPRGRETIMSFSRTSTVKNRRGSAAAIVILAMAFMGLLAVAGLETAVNETRGASAMAQSAEALYAAEAGLNSVLGDWPANQFVTVGVGDSLDMGWVTLPNGASYRAVIRRYDDGVMQQMRAIKVEAQGAGALGGRGVLWVWTTVPILYLGAVNAGGQVTLRGGAVSDAYDSREGDYGLGPVYPEGHINTNGNLSVEGSGSQVQGNAVVGGVVTGTVTGSVAILQPPVEYPDLPCPTTGYTSAASMPTGPKITYSAITGNLSVTGDTIRLSAGTYYFNSVSLSGQTKFVIDDGADVEIFVRDAWTVSGQAQINNLSRDASNLSIYGCGTSTTPWSMSSGNSGYFTVYAPRHPMLLSGGNAFHGAMTVGSLDVSGGAPYHFDKALLAGNHRGVILSRSWTQIPR